MIEVGCCLNMLSRTPDGVGIESLAELGGIGFDYWELPLAQTMALDAGGRERISRLIGETGIPCRACNNFFPAGTRLTGPAADHEGALAYARGALAQAKRFGASTVVFGSAKARNLPIGYPRERAWDQLFAFARRVGALAADAGIVVAMEHLNRGESDILTSFSENVRFVREVDHPSVRALVDFYHLSLEKEPVENLAQGEGLLAHAHVARLTGRTWPVAPARDLEAFFGALRDIGYDGRVSIEAFSDAVGAEAARALEAIRALAGAERGL